MPWALFLDDVLPYAALDEKRDVWFRARPRLYRLLAPLRNGTMSLYDGALALATAMPSVELSGALGLGAEVAVGAPVSWKSSTAPAYLSPQQVRSARRAPPQGEDRRIAGSSSDHRFTGFTRVGASENPGSFGPARAC